MRSKKLLSVILSCTMLLSVAAPVHAASLSFAKSKSSGSISVSSGAAVNSAAKAISTVSTPVISGTIRTFPNDITSGSYSYGTSGLNTSGLNSSSTGYGEGYASSKTTLLPPSLTLQQGKYYSLYATYTKKKAGAVKWSTTNSKILTGLTPITYEVQQDKNGKGNTSASFYAAKKGSCYLRLKVEAKTYKCRVRVTATGSTAAKNYESSSVGNSVKLDKAPSSSIGLKAGKTITKKVSIKKKDAVYMQFHINRKDQSSVYWSCTSLGKKSKMYASSISGKNIPCQSRTEFTFKKAGTYVITAKAVNEKGKTTTYKCKLIVK